MKPEIKKILFLLFLVVSYSLQAIDNSYEFSYIYFFGFMFAVILLYVIRNKYISTITGIVLLIVSDFDNTNYKYLTVIAFLLICSHKALTKDITIGKKSQGSYSFILSQIALWSTFALFIYSLILFDAEINIDVIKFSRAFCILFILVSIFIYSLLKKHDNKSDKKKTDRNLLSSLRFIYIINILGFSATVLFSYVTSELIHMNYDGIYFPWFVYICSMIYNDDPYILSIADNIEKILVNISYKDKVK